MRHNKQSDQASFFEKALAFPQRTVSIAAYRGEAHLLSFLYMLLVLSIVGYVYFVGSSIMNVIAHREATIASESLQTEVASLEQEYFELAKEVTPQAAAAHGLTKPHVVSFAKRDAYYATNVTADNF